MPALTFPSRFLLSLTCLSFGCPHATPPHGGGSAEHASPSVPNSTHTTTVSDFVPCEWYPLVDGAVHKYRGTFKGKNTDETINLTRKVKVDRGYTFVATDLERISDDSELVGMHSLMLRSPEYTDSAGIWMGTAVWKAEVVVSKLDDLIMVVRLPARQGDTIELNDDGLVTTVTVERREDIEVPAGRFSNCIKLRVQGSLSSDGRPAFSWYADGVGLVRQEKSTGRVEELVAYYIPGLPRDLVSGENLEANLEVIRLMRARGRAWIRENIAKQE